MIAADVGTQVRVGVAVVLRMNDGVLMGLRKGSHGAGTWSFPGGHLEPGETVQGCAARELREETGIDIALERFKKLTFTNDIFVAEGKHYITLYVEADFQNETPWPKVLEPEKCVEWKFWKEPPPLLFLPIENLLKDGFPIWKKTDEGWKKYEALFRWRDSTTDRWGEDLVALLAGLGNHPPDPRLPAEHIPSWRAFGRIDQEGRWAYAEAFVRATEPPGLKSYGEGDDDEEDGDPMKIRIEHDDQPDEVVEKINKALKRVGFELTYEDDESGDGFITFTLRDTNTSVGMTAK